jgi:hypothetical protein
LAAILSADCALREVIDSFLAFSTAMGEAKIGGKLHNQVKHHSCSNPNWQVAASKRQSLRSR